MRLFITGGTGFIGTHVVKKLKKEKHKLFILSKRLVNIDKWKDEVKHFKPEAVIHLAWEGIPDYSWRTSIRNLNYGLNLFKMLVEIGCKRIISTGTCWEYGQFKGRLKEDMAVKPFNAFTAAKNALHWLGREICKENKISFFWTRLFFVYGPGQRREALIPYIINCVQAGKRPQIKTPWAKHDFIYVEDVAEAIVKLLKQAKESGVYNIGLGKPMAVKDIIEIVYNQLGLQKKLGKSIFKSQINSFDNFYADISKIKKEISWQPKTDVRRGIKKTIDYYSRRI